MARFYAGFRAVEAGADLSAWFKNLPAGLSAAAEASAGGALSVGFAFSGTPERLLFAPVRITIPVDCIDQDKEVSVAEDDDNEFEFYMSAYIGDVTVAGDDFFALAAGADVDEIFRNLPPGITAKNTKRSESGSLKIEVVFI